MAQTSKFFQDETLNDDTSDLCCILEDADVIDDWYLWKSTDPLTLWLVGEMEERNYNPEIF